MEIIFNRPLHVEKKETMTNKTRKCQKMKMKKGYFFGDIFDNNSNSYKRSMVFKKNKKETNRKFLIFIDTIVYCLM